MAELAAASEQFAGQPLDYWRLLIGPEPTQADMGEFDTLCRLADRPPGRVDAQAIKMEATVQLTMLRFGLPICLAIFVEESAPDAGTGTGGTGAGGTGGLPELVAWARWGGWCRGRWRRRDGVPVGLGYGGLPERAVDVRSL